jgi:MoxR-vWA-beta-propeller ternary system domain bpX6
VSAASAPSAPTLRRPVHRGSVLACGFALEPAHFAHLAPLGDRGELEARRRVLAMSAQLSEVVRVGEVIVAILREPLRVSCELAPGAPLVRHGLLLSAAPLDPDEQAALPAEQEAIVLVSRGLAHAHPLDALPREDLVSWLELSDHQPRPALTSLGAPAAAPSAVFVEAQVQARAALGMAPLPPEGQGLLRSLLGARAAGEPEEPEPRSWLADLWSAMGGALGRLALRLGGAGGATQGAATSSGYGSAGSSGGRGTSTSLVKLPPPRRSWLRRAFDSLRELPARAILRTRLRNFIGRRYARYLQRVFEMFDGNRLDEALRHAIPLGGDVAAALRNMGLSPPAPRSDLALSLRTSQTATGLAFGSHIYDALKERYRRAFERLRDQGDLEKAAFVLAELLHADEEAVAFLEKHGKLRLAAELAEARNLPPGLVIRQWFRARDPARALRIARKSGAFADAVLRLARHHPDEAEALRILWADALATSGAYAAAVDVAWPVERAHALALQWIDRAIEIGGATGAIMLSRKARVVPAAFAAVRERMLALLADETLEPQTLEALATELVAGEPTAETRVLMRAVARRLVRERGDRYRKLLSRLLDACGDPALRIDAAALLGSRGDARKPPRAESPPTLANRAGSADVHWLASDRGAIPIHDACELPDGKLLLALGELGAQLISRDGRVLARFAEPAHHLVPSEHGDRAILVARRGESMRLARVDLFTKRARYWCDVRIDRFAADYDGATWFVASGSALYAIEATAERWQHSWKVEERDATITALRRDAQALHVWFASGAGGEVWSYELPQLTLRLRTRTAPDRPRPLASALSPAGDVACWVESEDGPQAELYSDKRWRPVPLSDAPLLGAPILDGGLVGFVTRFASDDTAADAAPAPRVEGLCLSLLDTKELALRARIILHGDSRPVGARVRGERLLVFDAHGRLLVFSLKSGEALRRLRLA